MRAMIVGALTGWLVGTVIAVTLAMTNIYGTSESGLLVDVLVSFLLGYAGALGGFAIGARRGY